MYRSPTSRPLFEIALAAIISASVGVAGGTGPSELVGAGWQDTEPPEAQSLAESVVDQPFNADKITRLRMHITMLVDRTSGIEGFASALEPGEVPLEDRLEALGAEETETEITIRLPGSILFDFDSAAIRPDARRSLLEAREVIESYAGRPVRVEGHTDSVASEVYNQKLSERRARSVADWLEAQGVSPGRLEVKGWGEKRPVAENATPEGRQQNRRVELIIEKE
jgi:outer membrane protein OmpA-like peptidoglycan-associated protein